MKTIRLTLGLVIAAVVLFMATAAIIAPLMPYLVVLFFLASSFYLVIKGR